MKPSATASSCRKFPVRRSVTIALHPLSALRSPHTPSHPDASPRSNRFRCGGRESNFLAVGVSPIGLNPDFSSLKWSGGKSVPTAFNDLAPITEEQRKILQQIVWDTVSNYPYSGVKKP